MIRLQLALPLLVGVIACSPVRQSEVLPASPTLRSDDYYIVVTIRNDMRETVTLYSASGMARTLMGTVLPGTTDYLVLSSQVADGCCIAKTADDRYADQRFVRITRRRVPKENVIDSIRS